MIVCYNVRMLNAHLDTTRQRREKEVEGYDYFFMDCSTDEFMQQCDEGLFLEAGTFHNNCYGTKLGTVTNTMEKVTIVHLKRI